jgi:ribose 5-phosphate isomerase B
MTSNNQMIAIASDHNGVELKEAIVDFLNSGNFRYKAKDFGTYDAASSVDYPDYAKKVVELIEDGTCAIGILICATGIGMSIAANRSSFVRAALCVSSKMAVSSRQHNDANILVLGARLLPIDEQLQIVTSFLTTKFEGGRHTRRINKL